MSEKKNASFKEIELGTTGAIIAANVGRLREGLKMTYKDLADRLEEVGHPIPPLGLRRIEARARRVTVDDLLALAAGLGVSPIRLLLGSSDTPPLGTAVPEDATFAEAQAWLAGEMDDFSAENRWRFWQRKLEDLEAALPSLEATRDRWAANASKNPDDAMTRGGAGHARRRVERVRQQHDEAQKHVERLRLILDVESHD